MTYTVFAPPRDDPDMQRLGILRVRGQERPDFVVATNNRSLWRGLFRYGLKPRYLIWTAEPFYDSDTRPRRWLVPGLVRAEIMNAHNRRIFTGADGFIGSLGITADTPLAQPTLADAAQRLAQSRLALSLFGWNRGLDAARKQSKRLGLICLADRRREWVLRLHQLGVLDHLGSESPVPGPSVDRRPGEIWYEEKRRLLSHYAFNFCLENSLAPFYITEKPWHAIQAGSVPIYYGGNGIEILLPRHAFLDLRDFENARHLAETLRRMPPDEWLFRQRAGHDALQQALVRLEQRRAQLTPPSWMVDLRAWLDGTVAPAGDRIIQEFRPGTRVPAWQDRAQTHPES